MRLALRDLARYRARSGSALAAISLGVLIAVLVCVLSAARYGNVLDYAGPNLASNQLIVYTPNGPQGGAAPGNGPSGAGDGKRAAVDGGESRMAIAAALGSHDVIQLDTTGATLHARRGRTQLVRADLRRHPAAPPGLRDQGLRGRSRGRHPHHAARAVRPLQDAAPLRQRAQARSRHPAAATARATARQTSFPCPAGSCLANPKIQEVGALPSGTSAPNTVITEHAVHQLGLQHQHGRLAHPDPAPAHRRADHQRQAHRGRGGPDPGDQIERALVGGDHQLGHRVRDRSWRWASWP